MEHKEQDAPLGLVVYNHRTGECIGAASGDGMVHVTPCETPLIEAMPRDQVGEVFGSNNPMRKIVSRGRSVDSFLDEDVPGQITMADGTRYVFGGYLGEPIDLTKLQFGQLLLPPRALYVAPQAAPAPVHAPTWSGRSMFRRGVDQTHPPEDAQHHPGEEAQHFAE